MESVGGRRIRGKKGEWGGRERDTTKRERGRIRILLCTGRLNYCKGNWWAREDAVQLLNKATLE